MKKWLFPLLLLFAPAAFGQNAQYQQILLGSTGRPVAGATVVVCSDPGDPLPIPCTTTVSIFNDSAAVSPKINPFTSDSLGNINFFAPPGNYVISVVGV